MSKKVIMISLCLLVITIGGIVGIVGKDGDEKKIKADPEQGVATIVEHDNMNEKNTNGCWIYYQYIIEGKTYKHCQKYHGWKEEDNYFQNKSFPIVYCGSEPDLSRLLIIAAEFENFGLEQPDSLKQYNGRIL